MVGSTWSLGKAVAPSQMTKLRRTNVIPATKMEKKLIVQELVQKTYVNLCYPSQTKFLRILRADGHMSIRCPKFDILSVRNLFVHPCLVHPVKDNHEFNVLW